MSYFKAIILDELDKIIVERLRDVQGIESTQTLVILRENWFSGSQAIAFNVYILNPAI